MSASRPLCPKTTRNIRCVPLRRLLSILNEPESVETLLKKILKTLQRATAYAPSKIPASFLRHRRLEASGFLSFKIFKRRLEASRVGLPPRNSAPPRTALQGKVPGPPRCGCGHGVARRALGPAASCEGLNLLVKNKKLEKAFGAVWSPGFLILRIQGRRQAFFRFLTRRMVV